MSTINQIADIFEEVLAANKKLTEEVEHLRDRVQALELSLEIDIRDVRKELKQVEEELLYHE